MTHESEDLPGMVALVLPEENCAMVKTTTGLASYTETAPVTLNRRRSLIYHHTHSSEVMQDPSYGCG